MKIKTIFVLLFFAVAIIGIIAPISAQVGSVSDEDKVYTIESKKKAASLKITWNANGGKIGSKKTTLTTVKNGKNLNKLATTPKRQGYSFQGWFTKKKGGKEITKNTKPKKSQTFYAQWTKTKVLSADEKKLVGIWDAAYGKTIFSFKGDGTFVYAFELTASNTLHQWKGKYSLKNGVLTGQIRTRSGSGSSVPSLPWSDWQTVYWGFKSGTDSKGKYFEVDYKNWGNWDRYYLQGATLSKHYLLKGT